MELFFRKYFWTVNLVFILLVALLVARTVNLFVESALTPMPSGAVSATRAKAKPTVTLASLDLRAPVGPHRRGRARARAGGGRALRRPRWTPMPRR